MADKFVVVATAVATSVRTPASVLENQTLFNAGPFTAFLGQTNAVTAAAGLPFPPGSEMKLIGNGKNIFAICAASQFANLQLSAGVQKS
jgi:hypothetical protein